MPRNSFLFRNCTKTELLGIPGNSEIVRYNTIDTCLTTHSIIQFRTEFPEIPESDNKKESVGIPRNSGIIRCNTIDTCLTTHSIIQFGTEFPGIPELAHVIELTLVWLATRSSKSARTNRGAAQWGCHGTVKQRISKVRVSRNLDQQRRSNVRVSRNHDQERRSKVRVSRNHAHHVNRKVENAYFSQKHLHITCDSFEFLNHF